MKSHGCTLLSKKEKDKKKKGRAREGIDEEGFDAESFGLWGKNISSKEREKEIEQFKDLGLLIIRFVVAFNCQYLNIINDADFWLIERPFCTNLEK